MTRTGRTPPAVMLSHAFWRDRFGSDRAVVGRTIVLETNPHGNIVRTIDSREVASVRLGIDRPKSAYFYNRGLGLRVDLLFDFPLPARDVRRRATRKTIQSYAFHEAIAAKDRHLSIDLQDLEFLKRI